MVEKMGMSVGSDPKTRRQKLIWRICFLLFFGFMERITLERRILFRKFLVGYLGCFSLPLFALIFSLAQGASWRPVLVGVPVYLTLFIGVTYQFVRDWQKLRRRERGEPDLPPKGGPWEEG